jgi:queuine tRNA-ribosyltransferase
MRFTIQNDDIQTAARLSHMDLKYGRVITPMFMPVGTIGTVKTLSPFEVHELGYNLILSNTYHLYLRPGMEILDQLGGISGFTGWRYNILTDSGGFQIYSLEALRKIEKDGVWFRSHIDGSTHYFSPESVVNYQMRFGSDIIMPLDICRAEVSDKNQALEDLITTHEWAAKSLDYLKENSQKEMDYSPVIFPIIQGNMFTDLRLESIKRSLDLDAPGYAIGGLSVGESKQKMLELVQYCCEHLPKDKPRYLMGVGEPTDLVNCIALGVDMFDSVFPTRVARNATVFTRFGRLLLRKQENAQDDRPIDEACDCFACKNFSRAYLRHMLKTEEVFGIRLSTLHNLHFIRNLIQQAHDHIQKGTYKSFQSDFLGSYDH